MLGQIERYIKQAIVDKNSMVASAALVSAMHFAKVLLLIFVGCCLFFVPPMYIHLESTGIPRDRAPLVQRNYCRH